MKKLLLLVLALTSYPIINFGQVPDLGSASSFALFTSVGAFNNVGFTDITSDIGTNVGAFGYPPGVVTGQIHVSDAVSAQAALDVAVAYSDLSSRSCGIVLGVGLGNGQILTANVYCIGAAATLDGDLILDGEGNPNALFIIKIDGALSTSVLSNVVLINSAALCNVFWQINGAFNSSNNSFFKGTVITNGAISLLDSSTLEGRILAIAGAINTNFTTVTMPCLVLTSSLPIELKSFTAKQMGSNIQFDWTTASETNMDYFTIQRSQTGVSFEDIMHVKGAGNSSRELYYSAIAANSSKGISYYRLKQNHIGGTLIYSSLVAVDFEKRIDLSIYPNPFTTSINITIKEDAELSKCIFRLYNFLGVEIMNVRLTNLSTNLETGAIPVGIYFYKIMSDDILIQSGRLVSVK